MWRLILILACASTLRCAGEPQTAQVCAQQDALYGASPDPGLIQLSAAQRNAIVRLESRLPGLRGMCSAIVITDEWLLSAKHCGFGGRTVVHLPGAEPLDAREQIEHPTLDLLLLRLPRGASTITPIAVLEFEPDRTWDGAIVQLAGWGMSETGVAGELRFAAQRILAADSGEVQVDGAGRSGACRGDSGGPVLARGRDGVPRVLGILSSGDATCTGIDRYVRVDAVWDWLRERAGLDSPTLSSDCASLDSIGSCDSGAAVWCRDGRPAAMHCIAPEVCGFDAAAGGFRCVAPELDACESISTLGHCEGDTAYFCTNGRVITSDCAACDLGCRRSSYTGRVECGADHADFGNALKP